MSLKRSRTLDIRKISLTGTVSNFSRANRYWFASRGIDSQEQRCSTIPIVFFNNQSSLEKIYREFSNYITCNQVFYKCHVVNDFVPLYLDGLPNCICPICGKDVILDYDAGLDLFSFMEQTDE